jgi:hypothetical protein
MPPIIPPGHGCGNHRAWCLKLATLFGELDAGGEQQDAQYDGERDERDSD